MTHIITMISNPENSVLEPILAENLRSAWGGGDVRWLATHEAAEFRVDKRPDHFWDHWETLQAMGIDLISQPFDGRKKQILIADMDSTMIQQECIDELAAAAGVADKVIQITVRAMNGEVDFSEALRERVLQLKGSKTSLIDTVLRDKITLTPGGPALLATMKKNGAYTALVSGGFTDFSAQIAEKLGFDQHRANQLLSEGGFFTGAVADPILGKEAKVRALNEIVAERNLKPDQVIAVGDGANDLGMLHLAGSGAALHAKPNVAAECDIRINQGDLTALLYIQGYCKDEFVF